MKRVLSIALVLVAMVVSANAATKTSIKISDLSKEIREDISKNYPAYTIKEAYRVDTNGILSYEVIIQQANNRWELYYDNHGKFLRKKEVVSKADSHKKQSSTKTHTKK